jgi:hypothetical protein
MRLIILLTLGLTLLGTVSSFLSLVSLLIIN